MKWRAGNICRSVRWCGDSKLWLCRHHFVESDI